MKQNALCRVVYMLFHYGFFCFCTVLIKKIAKHSFQKNPIFLLFFISQTKCTRSAAFQNPMAPSMGETSGLSPVFTTAGGGGSRHTFGETEPAAGGVAP